MIPYLVSTLGECLILHLGMELRSISLWFNFFISLFFIISRAMAGCVIEAFWAFGVILLALIAKYVQHWRYIQLAINIPTVATIFYIW